MNNLATTVVEEFLRSGTPQVRKNALTALSILNNDEETDKLIAETAIFDKDPDVNAQAERYVLSEPRSTAIKSLMRALDGDKPEYQQRAYTILGRLRNTGKVKVPRVRLGWTTWMWLATAAYTSRYPVRDWAFRLRGMKPGFFGTLCGGIPFFIYVWLQFRPLDSGESIIFSLSVLLILLLGTLISILGMQFITPVNVHLRREIALLVQMVLSFIVVFSGLLLILIVWSVLTGGGGLNRNGRYDPFAFLFFVFGFALLVAFVRLGTILAFGRIKFVGRLYNGNWLIQIAGGTLVGTLLTAAVYILFLRDAYYEDRIIFTCTWLGSFAITVGLATAFANIDDEVPPS
jgi:hypothetical protein